MGNSQETRAIGTKGFLIRTLDEVYLRVYNHDQSWVDYEITNHDCEVVIIDPDAAFVSNEAGDFLDYTTESMQPVK